MAEIRLEKSKWRKFCDKYPQISQGGGGGMAYFLAVEITLFAA